MPKITSGGASNAREELEPGTQGAEAAPVEAAEVPADTEVTVAAEHGPEPTELPEGDVVTPASPEAPALPPVASMSKSELQDHADSLGLPTDGTKADLAARITEHVEASASAAPAETAADAEPAVEPGA